MQFKQTILGVMLLVASIVFGQSTANNTSACSGNGVPTAGCNTTTDMPFLGSATEDPGLQTVILDALPVNTSPLSVKNYLYSGATTRIMSEDQPWWCNTSNPCNGHKVNGMEETNPAQRLYQAQYEYSIGVDVIDVDYYGCGAACGESSSQAYNLAATTELASVMAANPTTTPKLMIMLDGGSFDSASGGSGQCPPASGDQSACIIAAIETQIDYLEKTWLTQSYYETNSKDGNPIVMYFIGFGGWPNTNFSTVFAAVAAHATMGNSCGSGCTYARTVDFVDENSGAFSESGISGAYAWVEPQTYSSAAQFDWKGNSSNNYLPNFYSACQTNSSKICMGAIYKGFNDYNAGWGSNRVIAQQCGQVVILTAGQVAASGFSSSKQLQYLQLVTWNDYEESTELETGVDNCITVSQPTISNGTLSWGLTKSDATYASTSTINSWSIYTGTNGTPTTLYASGLSPSTTSYAAPPAAPDQQVWVYMVGQPLIHNQLSAPVSNGTAYSSISSSLTGWQTPPCSNLNPSGSYCAGGNGTPTSAPTQTIAHSSPSLDGDAMEISLVGQSSLPVGETTNVLWLWKGGANNNINNYVGVYNVYLPEISNIQALEYDQFGFHNEGSPGNRFMMGSECDSPTFSTGYWRIWNAQAQSWVTTSVPCTLLTTPGVWHNIQWVTMTDPTTSTACNGNPCMTYVSLTVDGVVHNLNLKEPSGTSTDANNNGIQAQIDVNSTGGTATEYLDEMTLTLSTNTITSYPLTVTTAGTGTVTSSPSGISCPSTCTTNYSDDTVVTLTEVPAAGYTFTGWSGACTGISTCSFTMSSAQNVTATFTTTPAFPVTVSTVGSGTVASSPTGVSCPNTCSADFNSGTAIVLTATAGEGFTFTGWSGACSGTSSTCSLTVTAAETATATFVVSGTTAYNLDDIPLTNSSSPAVGWASPPCVGNSCAGGSGTPSTYPQTIYNTSPSLDGDAMKLQITGTADSDVGWFYNNGAQDSATTFTLDYEAYLDANAPTANAFEYNIFQYVHAGNGGGTLNIRYYFGTQCVVGGYWQVWNSYSNAWNNTTVSCSLSALAWHHIIWNVHRILGDTSCTDSYPCMHYDTLTIDGTAHAVNMTEAAGPLPTGWGEQTGVAFQMDIGATGDELTQYLDEVNFSFVNPTQSSYALTATESGSGTVTSSPSGISCPSTCTASYTVGTAVTLSATPASGYTFTGWSGACSGTSTCSVTMSTAQNVTATFVATGVTFPLAVTVVSAGTVNSSSGGIICPSSCLANYATGTTVTLTETPNSGYVFIGWSGACTGTGTCSVTMDAAESVTATFQNASGGNAGVQTSVPDPPPGNVSPLPFNTLMYSGWNGQIMCEYQPWFFPGSGHVSIGMNEQLSATVTSQVSNMLARGCNVVSVDWYGQSSGQSGIRSVTAALLTAMIGTSLKLAIMEDNGAISAYCPYLTGSTVTENAQATCIQTQLISDMDYIQANYATSPNYLTFSGNPVVLFFLSLENWTNPTWGTSNNGFDQTHINSVWTAVFNHTNAYTHPYVNIFEYGSFTTGVDGSDLTDGEYGWNQPYVYTQAEQFCWNITCSANGNTQDYLAGLYAGIVANPSKLGIGVVYKGFDDTNASWTKNRVIAQQCGQVWLDTFAKMSTYFSTAKQIPFVQIQTWNDYEEGTEVETGIDNCWIVNAALNGNTVSWSLSQSSQSQGIYATLATIDHFAVWYESSGGLWYKIVDNIPTTATSATFTNPFPTRPFSIYVQAVGKAGFFNQLSNKVGF
jgi:uncharacterized repeat protein (TIGR02543 family)